MTADVVLRLVEERHNVAITLEGRCPGGEVGAHYGLLPSGERIVFKWSENPKREEQLLAIVDALTDLRADGYPMPSYGPVLTFDGGVLIAQGYVTGECSDQVSDSLGSRLLECRRLAVGSGLPIEHEPWGRFIARTLVDGADGWALHEPLRIHSDETRRVLDWIENVGTEVNEHAFHNRDLVHIDFHHRNAMQSPVGELAAVVDWEGVRQGDSAFDLVTLAFGLSVADCSPSLIEQVWAEATEATSSEVLTAYVAHMSLRRLDWTVRFHTDEIGFWLSVCEDTIRRRIPT